jgi:inorganic pyrophosphatase
VAGGDPPDQVNVVVEIPRGSSVKYEIDLMSGVVFVDWFLYTSTHFPFNYGFVLQTKAEDGDPLDALVLTDQPVFPTSVIRARQQIEHFFSHYKEFGPNKFVNVKGWKAAAYAKSLVKKSILPW